MENKNIRVMVSIKTDWMAVAIMILSNPEFKEIVEAAPELHLALLSKNVDEIDQTLKNIYIKFSHKYKEYKDILEPRGIKIEAYANPGTAYIVLDCSIDICKIDSDNCGTCEAPDLEDDIPGLEIIEEAVDPAALKEKIKSTLNSEESGLQKFAKFTKILKRMEIIFDEDEVEEDIRLINNEDWVRVF